MGQAPSDFGLATYHDFYLDSDAETISEPSDVLEHASKPTCIKKVLPSSSRSGKRLSLQVSSELHRELKLLAMEEEETMNSLIVRILRRHLKDRNNLYRRSF